MSYVVGVDVGTTMVKAVVMNRGGKIISSFSSPSKVNFIGSDRVEQDVGNMRSSVIKAVRGAVKSIGHKKIQALSLSTQGGTLILLDQQGKVIRPAISWMDMRAKEVSRILTLRYTKEDIYRMTGWSVGKGCLPLSQLCWLRKYEKDNFKKTFKFHFVDSYLNWWLTGQAVIDPTNAAITMLADIRQKRWSKKLLSAAGINEEQLPDILPSGHEVGYLLPEVAKAMGLPLKVMLYHGGHDQYCAALGAGVTKEGDVLLSTGTAWVVLAVTSKPAFLPKTNLGPGPHVIKNQWGLLRSIPSGGACLDWIIKQFKGFQPIKTKEYQQMDNLVMKIPAGSDGLIFIPHLIKTAGVPGALVGLRLNHTRAHFYRAVMEGLALEMRTSFEVIKKNGFSLQNLRMIGGGAKSQVLPQIIADVTGLPVRLSSNKEAASRGAGLLALQGARLINKASELKTSREKVIKPDARAKRIYHDIFNKYLIVSRKLEGALA